MTTIPEDNEFWGVDGYYAFAFPLTSGGKLQPEDTTPYEGLEIDGIRNFAPNPAQGTVVPNVGNGRLRDTIYRAPREPSRGELTVGYTQQDLKAQLSNVKTYTIGEMRAIGRGTNKQGSEPDVAFMIVQRGHNEDGLTRFKAYYVPKSRIIPRDSALNDNASEETFDITMSNSKTQIWGLPFNVPQHGFTDGNYEEIISEGAPKIVAWLADGIETVFQFPEAAQAISAEKIAVFNSFTGTQVTGNITKDTDGIEFDYPPSEGTVVVSIYEYQE